MPPPTRANNAMHDAPSAKPDRIGSPHMLTCETSRPKELRVANMMAEMPIRARPITLMPITEPPAKDTFNASLRLLRAAHVVRKLDWVAIFMPKYPASAEQPAPIRKVAASHFRKLWLPKNSRMAAATAKGNSTLFSRARNAMAPLATYPPMRLSFSSGTSRAMIQRDFQAAYRRASRPPPRPSRSGSSYEKSIMPFQCPMCAGRAGPGMFQKRTGASLNAVADGLRWKRSGRRKKHTATRRRPGGPPAHDDPRIIFANFRFR